MLLNVSDGYFQKISIEHLKDEVYYNKCVLILEILSHVGYAPYDLMCTQKEAKA